MASARRVRLNSLLIVVTTMIACACTFGGGGGGDSDPTFNLEYAAPATSGLANYDVDRKFGSLVLQDVELPEAVAVSGRVTDGFGAPMEGIEVSFHRTSASPPLDTSVTDARGDYAVDVPAGTWIVHLEADDEALGTRTLTGVTVDDAATMDFRFARPVDAPGVVYESDGRTPLVGARVELAGVTTGATASTTTDELGEYAVSLVPDTYEVVITPEGDAALVLLRQRFTARITGTRVLSFVTTRGIRLSGTILRRIGTPLPGTHIQITLNDEDSPFFAPPALTSNDVDGTYAIDVMPPGNFTFELQPPSDTGYPRQIITFDVVGPEEQIEDLTLAPGFVLRGTILQDDGVTPEPGVTVRAVPFGGALPPGDDDETDVTDASGRYAISLFPGYWDILVIPKPASGFAPEIRSFPIMRDLVLNVSLERGVVLTGIVRAPDGITPLPDVRVEIPDVPETFDVTDGSGRYSFLAPAGTHTLKLAAASGPFEAVALDDVDVLLAAPGPAVEDIAVSVATAGSRVVQGTVYGADGLTPVEGTVVRATDNQTGQLLGVTKSDVGGGYLMVLRPETGRRRR